MIKKYWKIIVVVIVLILAGLYIRSKFQPKELALDPMRPGMTIKVGKGNIRETISAEGFIEPIHQENLNFPARTGSVKVEKIHVKKGDFVEKGQLLIELDKTEARLTYLQRENAYNRALINGSRNEIEEARLNLELVKNNLENLDLRAPFAGIITDLYLEEGSYYSSGDALTIKDISRYQIEVSVDESRIPIVRVGQPVEVRLVSLPGVVLTGVISEIANEANNSYASVTIPVKVLLDKVDYDIKLGVSAQVEIIVNEVQDEIVIPATAVYSREGKDYVTKVIDGKQEEVPVETGMTDGLRIAIKSGLELGDEILVNTYLFNQATGNMRGSGVSPVGVSSRVVIGGPR
ncbi:MAG TPA: efflux RND transporter periplasmic adaptor subunit [Halanaerobiaceae bacterium]|jgi:multidrug efflux pump subunit AcrA (membrane-fusion protein)|nr:efflux RND transporter periplasmic adaptor subunit [Bacillota bacterium]HHU93417.1 efflux RND transporter periplasmic adaptor subunit [Halanaerobiaceae bacterium]HOA41579.1 efflux RND transporter periplasmic adaptor subunit [Halanaerobiales bacterium]HPZ62880.1 efflux RND transporter periplasmic adaptor subunit [Halanaerobiales bacterium]HQD04121.1 efflux RND transporter periplasmic adaptor subunit [Halanaerobiales bacterium]